MAHREPDLGRLYTADEFMDAVGSEPRYELIEGKIERVCAAAWDTSRLTLRLMMYIAGYAEPRGLGFVWGIDGSHRIEQDPDTLLMPDIAFVVPERVRTAKPDTFFEGSPDLVVEVRSPSDRMSVLTRKMERYLAAGSTMTWLVDPQRRQIHLRYQNDPVTRVLAESDVLVGDPLLPGFSLPLTVLFDVFGPLRPELLLGQ